MSTTRKRKNRGQQKDTPEGPSKLEYKVASYLREKCPKKQTLLGNQKVYYFMGSKAVDTLLDSKWAKDSKKEAALFTDRHSCVDYLSNLSDYGMFARAEKIVVKKVEGKKDKEKKEKDGADKDKKTGDGAEGDKLVKKKDVKDQSKEKNIKNKASDDKSGDGSDEPESPKSALRDADKKKKKIRLELHTSNIFFDNSDAYVWWYEPTSVKNIVMGTGLVLGAICVCLFPLWPPIVRQGVYYLSLVAIGLLGLLISVSLLRYLVFAIVWGLTFGKLHFWYLPNLTEDCGFFESFAPLYTCTNGAEVKDEKDKRGKKKKKSEADKEDDKEEVAQELDKEKTEESDSMEDVVNDQVEVES